MSTPELHLRTLFILNAECRMISTREPEPGPAPRFSLARGATSCAWAVRTDVSEDVVEQLSRLVNTEPPGLDYESDLAHADQYTALIGGRVSSGPAFTFPYSISAPPISDDSADDVVSVEDLSVLDRHFRGWTAGEIPERTPMVAVIDESGDAISVCFCARRTDAAAEAGVETAAAYRGRGLATCVAAAWAVAVRASGRVPLYSTSWTNAASLAVARRLGLLTYASHWSLWDREVTM